MMMKTKQFFLLIILSVLAISVNAQGFQAPTEGKAAVYFVRVTNFGAAISFEYFHKDQFVGRWKGKNYMRMEVEAGEHLFWVSSENKEFLTAELEAGETYVVLVDVAMGFGKARVGLSIADVTDEKVWKRVKALVNKKAPKVTSEEDIKRTVEKLEAKNFIPEKLEMYETVWKQEKRFKHISAEMAIPKSEL